ncbi:MICOS complex subunit Mic10-like [Gigantopelta aegis]|uniref:MICOS complex subunit Mic10-like n=1 Tax=Gigantopelta aegis TaxID=1735272 RepID=UPI001B8885AF|nr:MICOS complex subunit Mic10-like [Gigantopelta aegis]
MASPARTARSEDIFGQKWDRCLSDTAIKIAGGLGLGIVFSVVFFRRRPWPVSFGMGVGLGMAYSNCQNDFQNPYHVNCIRVQTTEKTASP